MLKIILTFVALASAPLFFSPTAQADWQGNLKVDADGMDAAAKKAGAGAGKIFSSKEKIRVEMEAMGQSVVILGDVKGKGGSMLMPAQKLVMDLPPAMAEKKMLTCSSDDIEGCLKQKKYKKTGSEKIDGHPCDIWEGEEANAEHKIKQKIWRPTDLKEVFMVKSVTTTEEGKTITTTIKDVKIGKLDASLFKVPAGFNKMKMPNFGG